MREKPQQIKAIIKKTSLKGSLKKRRFNKDNKSLYKEEPKDEKTRSKEPQEGKASIEKPQ